jgi:hypothetical protein
MARCAARSSRAFLIPIRSAFERMTICKDTGYAIDKLYARTARLAEWPPIFMDRGIRVWSFSFRCMSNRVSANFVTKRSRSLVAQVVRVVMAPSCHPSQDVC